MNNGLASLVEIGFKHAGRWERDGVGIAFTLDEHAKARNVLYAFAVGGDLVYVGKTIQPLRTRMSGYRNPGPTQSTNIRNRERICKSLTDGKIVEIYVLPDNGLLHYGKFHVNLAAGLEDSIVRKLSPPWNGGQKESIDQKLEPTVSTEK